LPRRRSAEARSGVASSALVFAALGDETRLRLAVILCNDGPTSIVKLSAGFAITRQAITKHLRVMEEAGLVRSTQLGRESIWEIQQERLREAQRHLRAISEQWDQTLGRLKSFIER
jgi:predicted transcriptional regulator